MTEAWPAPAKLNLFLHVLGRRPDGYHELQTCFRLIDRCDWVWIEVTRDGRVRRPEGAAGVSEDDDLAVRAARLLRERSSARQGAVIRVEKSIPAGGGLGGGSSDAATVLVALNRLWRLDWPREELATLGVALGADVPVFVHGRSAWGEGVGERLVPIELPPAWYLVVRPGCEIATAEVFADPELTRHTPPTTINGFLSGQSRNDCEPVVRRRYPEVAQALDWLRGYAPARLTGTGACVFAAFGSESEARRPLAALPERWSGFVAAGLDTSPLLARERRAGSD
jgi:4-diphosphocytidyl-2-C-methyl-D-erythritol kinase